MMLLKKMYIMLKNIEDKIPDIINLATNTTLNVKKEIPSITNLAPTTSLNAKIDEVKNKIPNITNLAITTAVTVAENKISYVSSLSKKTFYNTKNFTARLKQVKLTSKNDIANFVKKTDFDNKFKKVASNKSELDELSKKVKTISAKLLTRDLINKFSILNGAKYFFSWIFQNYLLFIPAKEYIVLVSLLELVGRILMKC